MEDIKQNEEDNIQIGKEFIKKFMDLEETNDLLTKYKTKENPIITKEIKQTLENYCTQILNNFDDEDILKNFDLIYINFIQNKNILFFTFWFPYIKSREDIVIEILKRTKIYINNNEIKEVGIVPYSATLLNTYAFQSAIENNFSDNLINLILEQGKIKIPIEWIMDQIVSHKLEIVKNALDGENDCTINNQNLINLVSEKLETNENFRGIIKNKVKTSLVNYSNKSLRKSFLKLNSLTNIDNSTNILDIFINSKGREIINFLVKKIGKLSITKIIIFASLINFYIQDIGEKNENFEEFNIEILLKTICALDRKNKNLSVPILQGLFLIKQKKIAIQLLETKALAADLKVFQTGIEYKDLKFTLAFYELYKNLSIYENENLQIFITEKMYEDSDNIEIYLFLIKTFINRNIFKFSAIKLFLKITEDIIQINVKENELFSNFYNPAKNFILIAEVLNLLTNKFPVFNYNIFKLIQKCLEYSEKLLNLIKEDQIFREVILEKDLSNRTLLNIISQNNFLTLLKINLVEKIVDDLWKGPYQAEGNFLETSYNYKALIANSSSRDYDQYSKMRISLDTYKEEKYETNFTSIKIWRKNIYIKFYLELFFTLVLLLIYQIGGLIIVESYVNIVTSDTKRIKYLGNEINNFLWDDNNFNNLNNFGNSTLINNKNYFEILKSCNISILNNSTKEKLFNEAREIYLHVFNRHAYIVNVWILFLIRGLDLFLILIFSYILRFIYQIKFKRPEYGFTYLSDITLIALSIFTKVFCNLSPIRQIRYLVDILNVGQVNCYNFLPVFSFNLSLLEGDPNWNELLIISIICFSLWVKLFMLIQGTKTLGSIIVIFFLALNGIKYYLFIFCSATLAYACFANLNFYNIEGNYFRNIYLSFYYYTVVSVGGEPNYADLFKDSNMQLPKSFIIWVGGVLIFSVLILNSITMFNLIIARITNVYEEFSSYSQQLFIRNKIEIRKKYCSEEDKYDSLLTGVFPFEIFAFVPSIFFLFTKSEKLTHKINKIVLWVNFSFYAFIYALIYLILNILLIPVSFFKVIYSKFIQIFIDDIQEYFKIYKIFSLFIYFIFGLFFHIIFLFFDFIVFLKQLNKDKINLITDNENSGKFKVRVSMVKLIQTITSNFKDDTKFKIHIEKFLEILLKVVEKEDQIKLDEIMQFLEKYNQDNDLPRPINEEFNVYINQLGNKLELKGYDYLELCEFLSNFWDDRNVIDLTTMKIVINLYWKFAKIKKFYFRLKDKRKQNQLKRNLTVFAKTEGSSYNLSKTFSEKNVLLTVLNKTEMNGQTEENTANNTNTPLNLNPHKEIKILKRDSDYFRNSPNKSINNNFSYKNFYNKNSITSNKSKESIGLFDYIKSNYKSKLLLKALVKKKLDKFKIDKNSKEFCIIPIIPRQIIYLFLSSLKEYQIDADKKISENLVKNQKCLQEILLSFNSGSSVNFNMMEKKELNMKKNSNQNINKNSNNNINYSYNKTTSLKSISRELKKIEEGSSNEENSNRSYSKKIMRKNSSTKNVFSKFADNRMKENTEEIEDNFLIENIRKVTTISSMDSIDESPVNILPQVNIARNSRKNLTFKSFDKKGFNTRNGIKNKTYKNDQNDFEDKLKNKISNEKVLTSVEIIRMEQKFERVECRISKIEENIEEILNYTKAIYNKMN